MTKKDRFVVANPTGRVLIVLYLRAVSIIASMVARVRNHRKIRIHPSACKISTFLGMIRDIKRKSENLVKIMVNSGICSVPIPHPNPSSTIVKKQYFFQFSSYIFGNLKEK